MVSQVARKVTRAIGSASGVRRLLGSEQVLFTVAILSLLGVWYLFGTVLGHASTVSSPLLVWDYTVELLVSLEWVHHLIITLRRAFIAFIIASVVGIGLAVLMGFSPFWEAVFADYVILGLSLPSLLMIVFAAMWFGVGGTTPIVAASLLLIPYNAQLVHEGVKDVDGDLIRMARSFSLSTPRIVWRIILRSILPSIVAAWRLSLSAGWKVVSLAEFLAAEAGFGFIIREQYQAASLTGVIGWSLLFIVIVLAIEYGVFRTFEHVVFDYRDDLATTG